MNLNIWIRNRKNLLTNKQLSKNSWRNVCKGGRGVPPMSVTPSLPKILSLKEGPRGGTLLSLSLSLYFFWSGHASSSLWSNVEKDPPRSFPKYYRLGKSRLFLMRSGWYCWSLLQQYIFEHECDRLQTSDMGQMQKVRSLLLHLLPTSQDYHLVNLLSSHHLKYITSHPM